MKHARDDRGNEYIVARERGADHGVELVHVTTGELFTVPNLAAYQTWEHERPIHPGKLLFSQRPEGWLTDLRKRRFDHVIASIKGRAKAKKVDKSTGATPSTRKRGPTKKELAEANRQAILKTLECLPPEQRAATIKALGL
jgi:hypothetical protein